MAEADDGLEPADVEFLILHHAGCIRHRKVLGSSQASRFRQRFHFLLRPMQQVFLVGRLRSASTT